MQCILEISLKKIKSNWEKINKYSNFKGSAVVKANAYGFGLEEIAIALNQSGCKYFYVAQIEEGIKLRNRLKSDKIKNDLIFFILLITYLLFFLICKRHNEK